MSKLFTCAFAFVASGSFWLNLYVLVKIPGQGSIGLCLFSLALAIYWLLCLSSKEQGR